MSFPVGKNSEQFEQVYPRNFWPEKARKLQETERLDHFTKYMAP